MPSISDHAINVALLVVAVVTGGFEFGIWRMMRAEYRKPANPTNRRSVKWWLAMTVMSFGPLLAVIAIALTGRNLIQKVPSHPLSPEPQRQLTPRLVYLTPAPTPTPHALSFEQTLALTKAFADAALTTQAIWYRSVAQQPPAAQSRFPPLSNCSIEISSLPSNQEFAQLVRQAASQECGVEMANPTPTPYVVANADATPTATPAPPDYIKVRAAASRGGPNQDAADQVADLLVKALAAPPLSLAVKRSREAPNDWRVHIDLYNVSPWNPGSK